MKLITKIKKATREKKTNLWIDANLFGDERSQMLRDMVLSMPKGCYHLHQRERGDNLVDEIFEKYGWMPSLLIDEPLILGMTILYPKKIYATFTLGLDVVEIL